MLCSALFLSVCSFLLVFKGAGDEPFMGWNQSDAMLHVGGSAGLITLWGLWAGGSVLLVKHRQIHPAWLLILVWTLINQLYLHENLSGYLWDIDNLVLRVPPYLRRC